MSSSEDEYDPAGALEDLDASIDSLEAILEPLLSGKLTWQELVEQESQDSMGKAKLNMMMAFGVCDLLFVYLQMKGHDTADHPVMVELKRIMEYNGKIKEAEATPKVRRKLDTTAAGRFIQAAIPRSQRLQQQASEATESEGETSKAAQEGTEGYEEIGMSSRFKRVGEGEVLDLSGQ